MPLKITIKSGPTEGKVYTFADDRATIRVGRGVDCDVSFPEELAIVAHDHFALRREAGGYKFVVNPSHRVFIDGKDAYQDMPLADEAEIVLGKLDGPVLLLRNERRAASNWIPTTPQGTSPIDRTLLQRLGRNVIAVAGGVAGLAAIGVYLALSFASALKEVETNEIDLRAALERAIKEINFSPQFETATPSVYLVDIVNLDRSWAGGGGTAWVVALPDGSKAFATNAHVAADFERVRKDPAHTLKMVARSPKEPHVEYEIVDVRAHPAYSEFEQKLDALDVQSGTDVVRDIGASSGYDVALLVPDRQKGLPPPLPLATVEELNALRPGQPLGMLGYPMENSLTTDRLRPVPQRSRGFLTAQTTFFMMPGAEDAQLLLHSVPATGGSSGSPIINAAGHVVGLLNAGNITTSGLGSRTPSAVMVNFAQRVDLLRELIDGAAPARLPGYRTLWTATIADARRPVADVVAEHIARFRHEMPKAENAADVAGTMVQPDPLQKGHLAAYYDIALKAKSTYFFISWTQDRTELSAFLFDVRSGSSIRSIETGGPIAILEVDTADAQSARLALVSAGNTPAGTPNLSPVNYKIAVLRAR